MGTKGFHTLERLINLGVRESLDIRKMSGKSPYYLLLKLGNTSVTDVEEKILYLCKKGLTTEDLVDSVEAPKLQKYDSFIPHNLLRKAFAANYLDIEDLSKFTLN